MRLTSLTLTNFRCFGPAPTTIVLTDLTAFVGTNACGKTAILQGLQRVFGMTGPDRELKREDFHVPRGAASPGTAPILQRALSIEAILEFPELAKEEPDDDSIAECFRQMVVTETGGTPYCRVRLEGTWTESSLPEGTIEQHTYWVTSAEGDEEAKREMRASERSRVHLHYVPASRDPARHIRQVSGSIMARLFKAVKWSNEVKGSVAAASNDILDAFTAEGAVTSIQGALSANWTTLHDAAAYSGVKIRPISNRFEDILRQVEAVFTPSPGGEEDPLDRLSDGQRSLFYLAMVGAAFDIEEATLQAEEEEREFDLDRLDPPSLTVFAFEEPENHISPHFLGRIMDVLRKLERSPRAQVLLTSHSPSIMHRIDPTEVRHLRLDQATHTTKVRSISLPATTDEAYPFVREAVRAYPELYFARLVILGEGDSEEIVLPRLAEAAGIPIDQSFISIVPLGGRHVNHFWRLLAGLDIPHLTLLDFDRERDGGGWGRIKYALNQLLAVNVPRDTLLVVAAKEGDTRILSQAELDGMEKWPLTLSTDQWRSTLEAHGVYFSAPLDLDALMLESFPVAYRVVDPGNFGPRIPKPDAPELDARRKEAIHAVLGSGTASTYTSTEVDGFFWYRYLFLGRSKPTSHLQAMTRLSAAQLTDGCPPVLARLIDRVRDTLALAPGGPSDVT